MYNLRENPATVKTVTTQPVWTFLYRNAEKGHNLNSTIQSQLYYQQIPPEVDTSAHMTLCSFHQILTTDLHYTVLLENLYLMVMLIIKLKFNSTTLYPHNRFKWVKGVLFYEFGTVYQHYQPQLQAF